MVVIRLSCGILIHLRADAEGCIIVLSFVSSSSGSLDGFLYYNRYSNYQLYYKVSVVFYKGL